MWIVIECTSVNYNLCYCTTSKRLSPRSQHCGYVSYKHVNVHCFHFNKHTLVHRLIRTIVHLQGGWGKMDPVSHSLRTLHQGYLLKAPSWRILSFHFSAHQCGRLISPPHPRGHFWWTIVHGVVVHGEIVLVTDTHDSGASHHKLIVPYLIESALRCKSWKLQPKDTHC